jgi:hypothetical protein
MEKATELEWLEFFYDMADFGPADGDVRWMIKQEFKKQIGKALP